jgi:hypothetical protein
MKFKMVEAQEILVRRGWPAEGAKRCILDVHAEATRARHAGVRFRTVVEIQVRADDCVALARELAEVGITALFSPLDEAEVRAEVAALSK